MARILEARVVGAGFVEDARNWIVGIRGRRSRGAARESIVGYVVGGSWWGDGGKLLWGRVDSRDPGVSVDDRWVSRVRRSNSRVDGFRRIKMGGTKAKRGKGNKEATV